MSITINGSKFDRAIMDVAKELSFQTKTQPFGVAEAQLLWKKTMADKKVTANELRTVEYIMNNYPIDDAGRSLLKICMGDIDDPSVSSKKRRRVQSSRGKTTELDLSSVLSPMKLTLYTCPICPFAHRVVFAAALLNLQPEITHVPLSSQVSAAEKLGVEHMPLNEPFKAMTAGEIKDLKMEYMKETNVSGEVPTLKTGNGDIILESEICAEFLDGLSESASLVPEDLVLAARMRLAMKRFGEVVPCGYRLLRNQDPAADVDKAAELKTKLEKFAEVLDAERDFCVSNSPTLADVHCAPFLWRFKILLAHYRGYNLFEGVSEKLPNLLSKFETLLQFQQLTPISPQEIIQAYEIYSHDLKWVDTPEPGACFAGRGKSVFGA